MKQISSVAFGAASAKTGDDNSGVAAAEIAARFGLQRRAVYARALDLKRQGET